MVEICFQRAAQTKVSFINYPCIATYSNSSMTIDFTGADYIVIYELAVVIMVGWRSSSYSCTAIAPYDEVEEYSYSY